MVNLEIKMCSTGLTAVVIEFQNFLARAVGDRISSRRFFYDEGPVFNRLFFGQLHPAFYGRKDVITLECAAVIRQNGECLFHQPVRLIVGLTLPLKFKKSLTVLWGYILEADVASTDWVNATGSRHAGFSSARVIWLGGSGLGPAPPANGGGGAARREPTRRPPAPGASR